MITPTHLKYSALPPQIVYTGKIIRRSKQGGFIFLRDDGNLYLSRLSFGSVQYIEREKLGLYLEKADFQMLKKLGVLSSEEVKEAISKGKEHALKEKEKSVRYRFIQCAKQLGIEATAKGILPKS